MSGYWIFQHPFFVCPIIPVPGTEEHMSQFSYFHAEQAEKFAYYRIPKTLFTDERFITLSTEAKLLYRLMLDRVGLLSRTNGLIDSLNRVYVFFILDEVMECFRYAREKANKLIAELDARGIGLIETRRQGLGKANIIYIKDFSSCG